MNRPRTEQTLSYHGTFGGLMKAVWLPLLALVVVTTFWQLLVMMLYILVGLPFLVTWLIYHWYRYVVNHTQHHGVWLRFRSEESRLFLILVLGITVFMVVCIAIFFTSVFAEKGNLLSMMLTQLWYAISISFLLHLLLRDFVQNVGKENSLAKIEYRGKKMTLFAVVLASLSLRLLLLWLINTAYPPEYKLELSYVPPFVFDGLFLLVLMTRVWDELHYFWLVALNFLAFSCSWSVIGYYVARQLVVQGERWQLKRAFLYSSLVWQGWLVPSSAIMWLYFNDKIPIGLGIIAIHILFFAPFVHLFYRTVLPQIGYTQQEKMQQKELH
jgi:hypothetical protein